MTIIRLTLLCALASSAFGQAPTPDSIAAAGARRFDSLLTANRRPLTMQASVLAGPGAAFLLRESRQAQFVAVGERHGIREIPVFVDLLLRDLHATAGFDYLATENGAELVDAALRRPPQRHRDSVVSLARRYPAMFEFNADEDLLLIGDASARLGGGAARVWGLDQEFGALYFLHRLRALSPPAPVRSSLDSLIASVAAAERRRFDDGGEHWMGKAATPEMFARLRAGWTTPPPDAVRILTALEQSAHLYDLNRRASSGEPVGFLANDEREQLMKRNFVAKYTAAARDGRRPKVVLKMGQAHLGRGQSPFGPFTVGNLISELAASNATASFHLAALAHNAAADSAAPSLWTWPAMRPLAISLPTDEISVVDLRPFRRFLYSNRLGPIESDLRRMIYAYDAVVVFGGAHAASEALTRARP